MADLSNCFLTPEKQFFSVIGSGGKSSLIHYLAEEVRNQRVLISTTTKIAYPQPTDYDYLYTDTFNSCESAASGITIIGDVFFAENKRKKLQAPKAVTFSALAKKYDKVFLEADGSKQLPLKGWAAFEPVVVVGTTATIGVVPIKVLGKKITADIVHRLPIFLSLTETKEGEIITPQILAKLVETGLFQKAQGQRVLYINQVETPTELKEAETISQLLRKTAAVDKIVAGSVKEQTGVILWQK
ncbi:selenium cofactor biosynthesis protein YqeC [Enterococcus sp. HY326]|uniref:selenium cofactor biosynthesis protein YqeC n=1 Tax=Enterococcus sp. HY326 TaxID=2971265 RepID=UPI00223F8AFF|nr:selenium cofactor biosynthesis protein YqeC [Enterococcus sp. HY326]